MTDNDLLTAFEEYGAKKEFTLGGARRDGRLCAVLSSGVSTFAAGIVLQVDDGYT